MVSVRRWENWKAQRGIAVEREERSEEETRVVNEQTSGKERAKELVDAEEEGNEEEERMGDGAGEQEGKKWRKMGMSMERWRRFLKMGNEVCAREEGSSEAEEGEGEERQGDWRLMWSEVRR